MADTTIAVAVDASTLKKGAKKDKKIARPKANHPTTAIMVTSAIQTLKERGGSSLQAIKKYIAVTYKIDTDKFSPFIKKYLKASVVNGALVQTKGKGASGSFKLATTSVIKSTRSAATKAKKQPVVKKVVARKVKAAKPASPKKPVAKRNSKVWVARKAKVTKASPAKAKKTVKSPAKKSPPKPKAAKGRGRPAKKTSPKKK